MSDYCMGYHEANEVNILDDSNIISLGGDYDHRHNIQNIRKKDSKSWYSKVNSS